MSIPISLPPAPASLAVRYEHDAPAALLAQDDVIAVIGFGSAIAPSDDPRVLRVGLSGMHDAPLEVWRGRAPVRHGRDGELRWSSDGETLYVSIEVDEARHDDLRAAARHAYSRLCAFVAATPTPHLLRLWNYLDAINLGDGDDERYRRFCEGRALGMQAHASAPFPAATAIGRVDGVRTLQVFGIAGRVAGTAVENPRQVSAWRYPREYGPTAPTFARGMRIGSTLLISGTAAVVGHASRHAGDLDAQLDETIANLESLVAHAGTQARLGPHSLLKAYVRDPRDAPRVQARLRERMPSLGTCLVLTGDICRRELLVEIDGITQLAG